MTGYCCPLQCEEKGHEALAGASPECSSPKCKAGRGRKCPALSVPSSGVAEGHEPHPWGWLGDVGRNGSSGPCVPAVGSGCLSPAPSWPQVSLGWTMTDAA